MIKDYNINQEPIMIKRALLSVYDKTKIKELALNLVKHNIEIIGENEIPRNPGKDSQCKYHNRGTSSGQTIDSVSKVGPIGNSCNNKDYNRNEQQPRPLLIMVIHQ